MGVLLLGNLLLHTPLGLALIEPAAAIITKYTTMGFLSLFILSIFCGMLVCFATGKKVSELVICFCVTVFVICGFPHCIATMVYYTIAQVSNSLWVLAPITLGNAVGSWLLTFLYT